MALLLLAGIGWRVAYALYPYPYRNAVRAAAAAHGLDPRLLLAVMRSESRFRPEAVSAAGAVGLMQITPTTAAWIERRRGHRGAAPALTDPAHNIATGAWYLAYLLRRFSGRTPAALAAYNAGVTPVRAWLRGGVWDGTAGEAHAIPYPETRVFVQRVVASYAVYRLLYRHSG